MFADIGFNAVVGTKQVLKALQEGALQRVYIAEDAEAFLQSKIKSAAEAARVEIVWAENMKSLGAACKIDVGAACVGISRE